MSSVSVSTPALLQNLAKKKVVSIPPDKKLHQIQFPDIPLEPTNSVTAKGVSAAKVVATMEIPAISQGIRRLPRKKLSKSLDALFRKYSPMVRLNTKKAPMINQSQKCNSVIRISKLI